MAQLLVGVSDGIPHIAFEDLAGALTPLWGHFQCTGRLPGDKKCQGFTSVLRLYPPSEALGENYATLRFRVTGSGRETIRWYSVSWQVSGHVRLGYNDQTDDQGMPVDDGWTPVTDIKMVGARGEMLSPRGVLVPRYADDGLVGSDNFPGYNYAYAPLPENQVLDVRVLGGQIALSVGGQATPLLWPHPQTNQTDEPVDEEGNPDTSADVDPDWYIDAWQMLGGNIYGAEWAVHPTKWAIHAATISQDINIGFVPDAGQTANTKYRVHTVPTISMKPGGGGGVRGDTTGGIIGWQPPGCAVSAETYDFSLTNLRYRLEFTNTKTGTTQRGEEYADYTSAVRSVTVDIPGIEFQLLNPPTILGNPGAPPDTEGLDIYHQFDLGSLTISSRAELTFNNFKGVWTNGYGSGVLDTTGHLGIAIDLGIRGFEQYARREFTGIFNTSFSNNWQGQGNDRVTVMCTDLWAMLDVPVWNLPWFDGWNVYAVMAHLAARGTITKSQLAFASFVPDDPYDPSPGLTDAEQQWMPIGVAGSPLTRFGNGEKLRDIMLKIANSIGYTIFFDVFGTLRFFKFELPHFSPLSVKTFYEVDTDDTGLTLVPGTVGMNGIWSGSYSSSLDEVRNNVVTVGVSALASTWTPLVGYAVDSASIYDDSSPNYIGWPRPMVWVDSLFATQDAADRGALSMRDFLRIPDKTVGFSTWYQGTAPVYPGDLIRVLYTRSGCSFYTFFVTGTHASHRTGEPPRLDIQARLVPGSVLG